MRATESATLAMHRLAEVTGAKVESEGKAWKLSYGKTTWPGAMPSRRALASLVIIAKEQGLTYPEISAKVRFRIKRIMDRGHMVFSPLPCAGWVEGELRKIALPEDD